MSKHLESITNILRENIVLCVAALAALASMVAVPPNADYLDAIDWRTLGLLFCLMACVQGLTQAGIFAKTGELLLRSKLGTRTVALVLVGLCFFVSMFVTNDVALITFVPFALYVFAVADRRDLVAVVVVLQTIAANLGSMATPMGNPQNLFLFTHYSLGIGEMTLCILPFTLLSAAVLALCCFALLPRAALIADDRGAERREVANAVPASSPFDGRTSLVFGALFVLSVLTVLNVVPLLGTLAIVVVVGAIANRTALIKVDYGLLATFVCFFVFSGNLAHIAPIRDALTNLMATAPFAASLITSQFISNVPAATLLAPFTASWQSLMLGVDIGGLGTPVASLASLISLEFFRRAHIESTGRYLAIFTALNLAFLAANILLGIALAAL